MEKELELVPKDGTYALPYVAFWYIVCYNRNQQLFNFVFVQGEQKMKDLIFSVFPSENFVDLGLYQFGWERCKPAHSFCPAARNHYLFHYIMSGTGRLITTDENGQTQSFSIKSRQGFMIFPKHIPTANPCPQYTW